MKSNKYATNNYCDDHDHVNCPCNDEANDFSKSKTVDTISRGRQKLEILKRSLNFGFRDESTVLSCFRTLTFTNFLFSK